MKHMGTFATALVGSTMLAWSAFAADLAIVHGAIGKDNEVLRAELDRFEAATGNKVTIVSMPESTTDQFGQYKLWLSAQSADIDVYRMDVIWAPQLAEHFVDLTEATADIRDQFIPSTLAGQTVDGKLVALPMFIGAPALYCREDLLEKYGEPVPATRIRVLTRAALIMARGRCVIFRHACSPGSSTGWKCSRQYRQCPCHGQAGIRDWRSASRALPR